MEESAINDIAAAIRGGLASDSPEELQKFIILAATIAVDYKKAVCDGVKKRGTDARKNLGEIKKMALDMRKKVLEVRKESKPEPKPETKPSEPKPESKSETKPEVKSEPKTESPAQ